MAVPIVPSFTSATSTYGGSGIIFTTEFTSNTTASSATVLSPPGTYFVITGAQNTVQYTPNAGGTFRNIIAASSQGYAISDGATVQITNTSTGGTSARYFRVYDGTS